MSRSDFAKTQTALFFSAIWQADDIVEVRAIWPERNANQSPHSLWHTAGEWETGIDAEWLDRMNRDGWNLYAGVLPRAAKGGERGRGNKNALPGAVLWADIDHVTSDDAAPRLKASGLPEPSVLINTGHGVQCYWLLTEKRPPAELRVMVGDIATLLNSDSAVKNEERVLRIPGFVNHKPPVADAELLVCDKDKRYPFQALRELVAETVPERKPISARIQSGADDVTIDRARRYLAMIPGSGPGGRTTAAFRVAAILVKDYSFDHKIALDMLTRWDAAANMPPIQIDENYKPGELERILVNAGRYGKHQDGALLKKPTDDDEFDANAFAASLPGDTSPAEAEYKDQIPDRIPDPGPFPETLLRVPGVVGDFAGYITRRAVKPQPVLSLAAALVALGALAGRKVQGVTGLRTNIYALGIAETGTGKNTPREELRKILNFSTNTPVYMIDRLRSDAGIRAALGISPCVAFVLDEVGEQLEQIKMSKSSTWIKNIVPELMMLYSSASSQNVRLGGLGDAAKNVTVDCPHVCLFGTSVSRSVFKSMTMNSVSGGFLGRLLLFESPHGNPRKQLPSNEALPESVINAVEYWKSFCPDGILTGNHAGSVSSPLIVEESPQATKVFDRYDDIAREEIERYGEEWSGPYNRVEENARKLALIHACSACAEKPFIGENSADWGGELSLYLVRRLVYLGSLNISNSETHERINKIFQFILDAGTKGCTKSELTRKFKHYGARNIGEAVDTLIAAEEIFAIEKKGKTKSTYIFRANNSHNGKASGNIQPPQDNTS